MRSGGEALMLSRASSSVMRYVYWPPPSSDFSRLSRGSARRSAV